MANIYGKFPTGYQETITGTRQADTIYPLGGSDQVDGGWGEDTVVISADASAFTIVTVSGTVYVDSVSAASSGDHVSLRNVEFLRFNDTTVSLKINDKYTNTASSDFFDGGAGLDTVVYTGVRAGYVVSAWGDDRSSVKSANGAQGTDSLTSIERLQFADQRVALDLATTQASGQAVLLIGAVLGKNLLPLKQELMGSVIGLFDQGLSMLELSGALMRLPIWGGVLTPSNSSTDIARYLLKVVNQQTPSESQVSAAASQIDTGVQGTYLAGLAVSAQNQVQVDLVGLAATGFNYQVAVP